MKTLYVTKDQYESNLGVISNFDGQVNILPDDDEIGKSHLAALGIKSLPIVILAPKGRDNCLNLIKTYGRVENVDDIKIEL